MLDVSLVFGVSGLYPLQFIRKSIPSVILLKFRHQDHKFPLPHIIFFLFQEKVLVYIEGKIHNKKIS